MRIGDGVGDDRLVIDFQPLDDRRVHLARQGVADLVDLERTSSMTFLERLGPSWNWTTAIDEPWLTVESMDLTLERPVRAFSTGRVTWFSISAGAAPLRVTWIITAGNEMLGYCLIGRLMYETTPASTAAMNSTATGIGLRIAQADIPSWGAGRPAVGLCESLTPLILRTPGFGRGRNRPGPAWPRPGPPPSSHPSGRSAARRSRRRAGRW